MLYKKTLDIHYFWYYLVIIIASFVLGMFIHDCTSGIKQSDILNLTVNQNLSLFSKVLLKNFGFAILLALGFMFYNISTLVLISYNGYMWGLMFSVYSCYMGLYSTITLVITHLCLELLWIYCFSYFSYSISNQFISILNKNIKIEDFLATFKNKAHYLKKGVIILLIAAIIESFLSKYIYQFLN